MHFEEFRELYPSPSVSFFLANERITRDKIVLKKIYIDVAEDLVAGIVLNQIVFWHCPNDNGEIKLTVVRDGHLWLRKKREDWWRECRVTTVQFDKACKRLEALELIVVQKFKWNGAPTKHIRVNWPVFLEALERAKADYGNREEGYRHRPPTKTSGANRQASEPDQISANSENPISLLAEIPDFPYQRKSNFAISGNDLYINETSKETTRETPPPLNEEFRKEQDSDGFAKSSTLLPEQTELAVNKQVNHEDLCFAAPRDNISIEEIEHPVTIQERWFKTDHKKPDWAIRRIRDKWVCCQELVDWFSDREQKSKAFARDYLQKVGEVERTNDLWQEYQATLVRAAGAAVQSQVAPSNPVANAKPISKDQARLLREALMNRHKQG